MEENMNKSVCILSKDDCENIRVIYEKKLALENLSKIKFPQQNPDMYDRLIADYGKIIHDFDDWWKMTYKKYAVPSGAYAVDFSSGALIRVEEQEV